MLGEIRAQEGWDMAGEAALTSCTHDARGERKKLGTAPCAHGKGKRELASGTGNTGKREPLEILSLPVRTGHPNLRPALWEINSWSFYFRKV